LAEALDLLKRGEAQALYALDIDRLARSTRHLLDIAHQATREQWRLVVLSADVDTSSPAGEALLTVAAAFSQFEARMISERVKRQHEARRARGVVWGVDEGPTSSLPDETVAAIVKMAQEAMSLSSIAKSLNISGVPTAKGSTWQAVQVSRVLKSPRVINEAKTPAIV
jgi:DNA invertase Pin-like site-specific DNA recombinase